MKRARTSDYWRRCYAATPTIELVSISFENVPVLGNVTLPLGRGISAITGLNGTGKSTVLHTIWLCSTPSASKLEMALDTRLTSGIANLKLKVEDNIYEIVYDFSVHERRLVSEDDITDIPELDVTLISTSEIVPKFQKFIRQQTNLTDFVEQMESYRLDDEELKLVRYITGRSYDAIDVFEVEFGLDTSWSELPYFRVSKGNQQYGVEHLGTGELACLFLYWATKHIRNGSILLTDEPESFLAAHSQGAIADLIAYIAAERNVACVITSHSNDTVSRVPDPRRLITMMNASGLAITTAEESPHHLSALGIGRGTRLIAVVEDAAAACFLREIVTIGAPVLRSSIEVIWAGSSGQVVTLLNDLPNEFQHLHVKFVGILDGDQLAENHKCDLPLLYLPTAEDPEEIARNEATNHPETLASNFGASITTVQAALAKAEGADYHDWPFIVGEELGRAHFEILATCFRSFVANDFKQEILEKFIENLISKDVLGS